MNKREYTSFLNPAFLFMILYVSVSAAAYQMVTPILTPYAVSMNIAVEVAGVIAGIVSVTALVVRPFSGYLTDQLNKKRMLLFAAILMGVATLGLAATANVALLMFFRILQGAGFALNAVCCIAMATNYMPKDRIGEGIGYFSLGNIAAQSLASSLGLELSAHIGYRNTFLVAGLSVLTGAVLMFLFRYEDDRSEEARQASLLSVVRKVKLKDLFSRELFMITVFVGVFSFSTSMAQSYLALLAAEQGLGTCSLYFTISAVGMILTRPLTGKIIDKKGLPLILPISFVLEALAMWLLFTARSTGMVYLSAVLKALGQGSGQPALQAECVKRMGPERRGLATSSYYLGADVAQGIGPVIGGAIAGQLGYKAPFGFTTGLIVCAIIVWFVYLAACNRKEKSASMI